MKIYYAGIGSRETPQEILEPTVYGVGFNTSEKTKDSNGKHFKSYEVWHGILRRCYSKENKIKRPTYENCIVCDEWLYYKNFKEWYDKNYYDIGTERMDLDKDILHKGNKIYSPETCIFVPQSINTLFTKSNKNRGDCVIGVYYNETKGKYISQIGIRSIINNFKLKNKHLGNYNSEIKAFESYKNFKETYIKELADEYKDKIPQKLYDAMYRYEVEITD